MISILISWYVAGLLGAAIICFLDPTSDTTVGDLFFGVGLAIFGPILLTFAIFDLVRRTGFFKVVVLKKRP